MPRVNEQHRQARRDEIAEAAVRLLSREGRGGSSIAQIVAESGLSTGAIYANFESKSALARYVAEKLMAWRVEALDAAFADGAVHEPHEVLGALLGGLERDAPPFAVVLQFWAEATTEADLHDLLESKILELRDAFERAIRPWADQQPGGVDARRAATTMVVLCQGYLANAAVFGWIAPGDYLETVQTLFSPASLQG